MIRSLLALALAAAPSLDDAAAAEALLEKATALHAEGKLEEASAAMAEAYALYPDRDYLYGRATIEKERGRCDLAIPLFEEFLTMHPRVKDVQATEKELRACRETEPEPATREPEPEPPSPDPPPPEAAPIHTGPPDTGPRWQRDRAGAALVASGGALTLVGAGLLIGAAVRAGQADQETTTGDYRAAFDSARGLNAGGIAVVAVGGALLVGGIIRYMVVRKRELSR